MPANASLAVAIQQRWMRHQIDYPAIAEHARTGDLKLRITNISPEGFTAIGAIGLGRGERLMLRLPVIGRIEAQLVWHSDPRGGFRFERLIRLGDFTRMLIEASTKLR